MRAMCTRTEKRYLVTMLFQSLDRAQYNKPRINICTIIQLAQIIISRKSRGLSVLS